jgi:hypothetical protein
MIEFEKIPDEIVSFLPPVIVQGREEAGCNWAVVDGKWLPISRTVTLDMLRAAWKGRNPRQTKPTAERWEVKGSKGDKYIVEYKGGTWKCDCLGFGWRGSCKHVETIKSNQK